MKNVKLKPPVLFGIGAVVVIVSSLAIKSHLDYQAQVKREMEEYEVKATELRKESLRQRAVEEDVAKARAFSLPRKDEAWLKAYCAEPNSAYFSSFTKLYHSTAEEKAKKNGLPVPTTEQVIAEKCAGINSSTPSTTVSIEPVTPPPSP